MAVNADANRRLAPAANAQLVEPEEDPDTAEQNKLQPMRVWPGLKLIGAGGAIKKGTFVTVAACRDNIALESGSQARRALPTRSPTRGPDAPRQGTTGHHMQQMRQENPPFCSKLPLRLESIYHAI